MKKRYSTLLGITLLGLTNMNGAVQLPLTAQLPQETRAAAEMTIDDIKGLYTFTYFDIMYGIEMEMDVTLEVTDAETNSFELQGMFKSYNIQGTFDPESGMLILPYQKLGYDEEYEEDIVLTACSTIMTPTGEMTLMPVKADVGYNMHADENELYFFTNQYYCIVGENEEGFTDPWGYYFIVRMGSELVKQEVWTEIGTATFYDGGFFVPLFGRTYNPTELKVEKSDERENVYRLVNPWGSAFYRDLKTCLEFNITDKECIVIPEQFTGIEENTYGKCTVADWAGIYLADGYTLEEFKKIANSNNLPLVYLDESTIKMPIGSCFTILENSPDEVLYRTEANGASMSYIELNKEVMDAMGLHDDKVETIHQTAQEFEAYSIDGVKQNAGSLEQLKPGLYIINGKKTIVTRR